MTKRITIDKDLPLPIEQFRMFTTEGGGATVIISKVKGGFRYEVIPTVDGLVGHDKHKDVAVRNAKAAGRDMLARRANISKLKGFARDLLRQIDAW